jgi:hypothetical protein
MRYTTTHVKTHEIVAEESNYYYHRKKKLNNIKTEKKR